MNSPSDRAIALAFWALTPNGDSEIDGKYLVELATEIDTHPATEQPGKGEAAHQANESTLDRVIQAVSFDEHGKRHYVFGAQARARVAAALIPQPSDPAESESIEQLAARLKQECVAYRAGFAAGKQAALSTPPTAAKDEGT